ncbi:MAG: hypothetical protein H0T05_03965 [Acidobacteria bacterium]|nr:hypothetical protein [Acidobacteriota bacterium]
MRIEIGRAEALSKEYHSFDEFTDEWVEHENSHGRRVPDYDVAVFLSLIACYLLKKSIDKFIDVAIDEVLEERRRRKDEEAARVRDELEEQRHSELTGSIEELKRAVQQAVEARPLDSAVSEDAVSVSTLFQWARQNNVKITITLQTEAEGDLKEALEAFTKDVPGSSVSASPRESESGDST